MSTMLFGTWHTVGIVLGVFLLSVTGILVKQLIRRNGAISVFMGILFLMCSLFFSLSLFSELREFSSRFTGDVDVDDVAWTLSSGMIFLLKDCLF